MAAAGGPDALHGEPEDGHERLRVPGTARREPGEVAVQRVVDVGGREREVHRERASAGRPGRRPRRGRGTARVNSGQRSAGQLEAGRGRVAAEADEQVPAGGERLREVEPPVAPARGADHVADRRPDDRGPPGLVREAPGDEPDDPDGPRARGASTAGASAPPPTVTWATAASRLGHERHLAGHGGRVRQPERRPRLGDRRRASGPGGSTFAASRVAASAGRLLRRLREQQAGGVERLPHPPGGVEARREHEADGLEVHGRGRDAGPLQQRGDARAAARVRIRSRPRRAIARFSPRIGATSATVPIVASSARSSASASAAASSPRSRRATVKATPEPLSSGSGYAESARCGLTIATAAGSTGGQVVVVRDDDVDPARAGLGDLGDARGARVHRDDERDPAPPRRPSTAASDRPWPSSSRDGT